MLDAVTSVRGVVTLWSCLPDPRDWLQRRQMVRPLLVLFVPPRAMAMMWSGSALLGWRDVL